MFVVTISYTAPLARIDELLPEHVAWLQAQFQAGVFLAAGPQEPRVGGVILARSGGRDELEAILATDPFARAGVATRQITEFVPTRTATEFASLRVSPA